MEATLRPQKQDMRTFLRFTTPGRLQVNLSPRRLLLPGGPARSCRERHSRDTRDSDPKSAPSGKLLQSQPRVVMSQIHVRGLPRHVASRAIFSVKSASFRLSKGARRLHNKIAGDTPKASEADKADPTI